MENMEWGGASDGGDWAGGWFHVLRTDANFYTGQGIWMRMRCMTGRFSSQGIPNLREITISRPLN